jgi:hypothetical protein
MGGSGQRTSTVISNIGHIEHIERHREWPFAVGADALIVGISRGARVIHHGIVVFGWCSRVARWWVPGCSDRNVTIAK